MLFVVMLLFNPEKTFAQGQKSGRPYETGLINASSLDSLFRNSFNLFQFLRNDRGIYADAAKFEPPQSHPASVATIGMGMISLCIADAMGWINGQDLCLEILKNITGTRQDFIPDRNNAGYFRHFISLQTGKNAWNSEYSSIDTGILVSGALFCKNYFANNDSIQILADALYLSIDWDKAIADPGRGHIYQKFDYFGKGNNITKPFNEYMIVAWLAKHDFRNNARAAELWDAHYTSPENLPKTVFEGIELLTDFPGNILSGFVIQFAYYLCNYFTTSPEYQQFFKSAMQADKAWWQNNTEEPDYVWGFGAGASPADSGYHADNILDHPKTICSPHVISGFIPADTTAAHDLMNIYNNNLGVYQLPDENATKLLWRFSADDPGWRARDVQGADYSTMLFGLASLPTMLGKEFFVENNDFVFPTAAHSNSPPMITKIPETVLDRGDTLLLQLDSLAVDIDDFKSALIWSVTSSNDSLQILVDSATHIATFTAPNFIGQANLTFIVVDPKGASDTRVVGSLVTTVSGTHDDSRPRPGEFVLYQNFPNPFNISTTISFDLQAAADVRVTLFNSLGKKIRTLFKDSLVAGSYKLLWDGRDDARKIATSGVYFYKIETANLSWVGKMILVK